VNGTDIEQRVASFLGGHDVKGGLSELQQRLPAGAAVYLVGGAIRNLAIEAVHGRRPKIQDLDLFINRVGDDAVLSKWFPQGQIEITDLGGIRWRPAGCPYDLDLWLMKDFVVLAKLKLAPTLENLLSTLDFTMNTLVYDLKQGRLHQRNALPDIERRILEFNTRVFYTRLAICYRCLLLRHKIDFEFSEAVFGFLRWEVDLETLEAARQLFRVRHGKVFARRILEDYDRVCTSRDYQEYRASLSE
jgi:hypothetical protein